MKKILLVLNLLFASFAMTGCSEEEIAFYDQDVRLNFSWTGIYFSFTDADYLNGKTDSIVKVSVQIQGYLLDKPRTYCLKNVEYEGYKSMAQVEFLENPYTFKKIEGITDSLYVRVLRPEKPTDGIEKACASLIVFDLENPAHQFGKGREDKSTIKVIPQWTFKPNYWDDSKWGKYSFGKYRFMIDTLQVLYSDMWGKEEMVAKAYVEYKKNNPPILDDEGEEITFPVEE